MKTNKTYKTLALALAAVEKANATRFDLSYNDGLVFNVLERAFKSKSAITVAKNNLFRLDKTLYALECVKGGFKWTVVGFFDSDGLLYAHTEAPATEEKPKEKATHRQRKPAPVKGDVNFKAFKGTVSEKNKALHAELVSRGMKDSRTAEYQAIWQARPWAKA